MKDLNNTTDQLHLTDIYKRLPPTTAEYIFFSSEHGTFSRIDMRDPKISLNKFKIEIIQSIFFWSQWNETQQQKENWKTHR